MPDICDIPKPAHRDIFPDFQQQLPHTIDSYRQSSDKHAVKPFSGEADS